VEKGSFCFNGLFNYVEETNVTLERKPSVLEAPALVHCFSVRIELVLKGVLPANQTFHGGERLIFFQIGQSSSIEETCISEIKLSVLEEGA
jgi:hypothetical protein